MKNKFLQFMAKKTLDILEEEVNIETLGPDDVAGHTVYSMISSGTEINMHYLDVFDRGYPKYKFGYTIVFKVEYLGSNVKDLNVGDLVFCMGKHETFQKHNRQRVIKLPEGLAPEHALFARMAGVSMATISRMSVTPGEKIMVTGLGPIGFMAMLVYSNLGYEMIGVDPDENRREFAKKAGFTEIYEKVPFDKYDKQIGLALECSGNEAATLDCCNIVRPHGEVSIVGVPWKPYTEIKAFELLNSVFYNYVKIYSGWEWDLPIECSKFAHNSMNKNYRLALNLLAKKKIDVSNLYTIKPFEEAQKAYDEIYEKKEKKIATILSFE